jgi:hypothetical protein
MAVMRPILLNSCAKAATAAETRFRINAPIKGRRASRIVALDEGAAPIVTRVAALPWGGARFFVGVSGGTPGQADTLTLRGVGGGESRLAEQLEGAEVTVMVATANDGAEAAWAIGHACFERGVMTAGLVIGDGHAATQAVAALRPHARVLLVTNDEHDVAEVLTALRA